MRLKLNFHAFWALLFCFWDLVRANEQQTIDFQSKSMVENQLLVIKQADTDFQIQISTYHTLNPPGNRAVNTWFWLSSDQSSVVNSQWRIQSAYVINQPLLFQSSEYEVDEDELPWIKMLAQVNMKWTQMNFEQKKLSVKELHQVFPNNNDDKLFADGLVQLTWMYYELSEYQNVLKLIDSHLSKNLSEEAQWHMTWLQAESYLNLGKFSEAVDKFQFLISKLENNSLSLAWKKNWIEIKASDFIARSLHAFYIVQDQLPANVDILETLDQAILYDDAALIADVLYAQAINQVMHQNLSESIALLDVGIDLLIEAGAVDELYLFYHQKAVTYFMFNQLDSALLNYRESLSLVNESNHPHYWSGLQVSIAKVYRLLGEAKTALRYGEKALQYYQNRNLYNETALTHLLLGRLALNDSDSETALVYHMNALQYFANHNEKLFIKSLLELASVYWFQNNKLKAQEFAVLAWLYQLKFNRSQQDFSQTILSELNLSDSNKYAITLDDGVKKLDKIVEQLILLPEQQDAVIIEAEQLLYQITHDVRLEQRLESILESGWIAKVWDVEQQLDLYNLMLKIFQQQNNQDKINALAKKTVVLINDTHSKFLGTDTALYWTDKAQDFIDHYVSYLLKSGQHQQAFLLLEQQQSINMRKRNEQVRQGEVYSDSNQQLKSYLSATKEVVLDGGNQGNHSTRDVNRELFEKQLLHNQISSKNNLEVLSFQISEIQDKLNTDEVAIRFVLGIRPHVFMISKEHWLSEPLPSIRTIEGLVKSFVSDLQLRKPDYLEHSQELAHALRLNAAVLKNKKKLVIVTEGILSAVPFSALSLKQSSGDYHPLILDYDLIQTPSLSGYYQHGERVNPLMNSATIFSNPIFLRELKQSHLNKKSNLSISEYSENLLNKFQKLPQTQREAELIIPQLNGLVVKWWNRNQVTTDQILDRNTRQSDIIHLATHGYFSDRSMDHVGLATSVELVDGQIKGGFLSLRELFAKTYTSNLVVLSGCETIQGTQIDGEGMISLSRGFLTQGVKSVIASIWAIPDRVTPEFMEQFYKELIDSGHDVTFALNQAQRNFFKNELFKKYSHPYYWAGFVLTTSERM